MATGIGAPMAQIGTRSPCLQLRPHDFIIRRDGPIPRAGPRRRQAMNANDAPARGGDPAREALWDPTFLASLRRDLLRFAELQLRDGAAAEDAVQEALAAALSGQGRFAGQAALKTWVFAILKNKIVDSLRQRQRTATFSSLVPDGNEDEDDFAVLFDRKGFWQPDERPQPWGDPEATFAQQQFWAVFEACLTRLPDHTARVFMMREFLGLETPDICRELSMTTSNCHVILHRARMGLRLCLDQHWFTPEA
jgi:RNA polymerase sigma-70 factor (ECF subfamily)